MYRTNRRLLVLPLLLVTAGRGSGSWCSEAEKPVKKTREPDVIFLPTPQDVVERMLKEANVSEKDVVFDLGCGDGRIVITAAKKYKCRCAGYDIDPERVKESRENVKKNGIDTLVSIHQEDIFKLDLSKASVITLYLLPELNVRLIPQLKKLKPGSRIVSHDFNMRGVTPDKVIKMRSKKDESIHRIYLWTAPLKTGPKKKNLKLSAPGSFAILSIDNALHIRKTSEVRGVRRKALKEYRESLKAWRKARKAAAEAGREFTESIPKRVVIKTVASGLATEEAARQKLEELKAARKTAAGGS
jgi:SAM-dependent methyltransferase